MCCRTTKEKEDQRDRNRYAKRGRVNVNRFLDVYPSILRPGILYPRHPDARGNLMPELMPEEGSIAHGYSVQAGRGVKGLASGRVVRVDEAFRS